MDKNNSNKKLKESASNLEHELLSQIVAGSNVEHKHLSGEGIDIRIATDGNVATQSNASKVNNQITREHIQN